MTLFKAKNNSISICRVWPYLALLSLILVPTTTSAETSDFVATISQNLTTTTAETTVAGVPQSVPEQTITPAPTNDADSAINSNTKELPNEVIKVTLTAYTSTPDQTDDTPCITADNTDVCQTKIPTVAANWLPFGTKVKIPSLFGDKIFTAHDRMNKRYGFGRMDIWFDTPRAVALKFGVQKAVVEIYYPAPSPKELARD